MIESGYIIDGASFVLFNSFCHRECIVVGPARSGVAFEPNFWAGAAGTPPGVGSPSTGCTQGGVVPDALLIGLDHLESVDCELCRAGHLLRFGVQRGAVGLVLEVAAVPHSDTKSPYAAYATFFPPQRAPQGCWGYHEHV